MDSTLKVGIFATAFSIIAMGLPSLANAAPVTLRSEDGIISLTGTLLKHEGDTYIIETQLGTMKVAKSLVECVGEECPRAAEPEPEIVPEVAPEVIVTEAPAPAPAQEIEYVAGTSVILKSSDGVITLTGTLLEYEENTYLIETKLGTMRVEKSLVDCVSDGCPVSAVPSIVVRGSDTIGDSLMPSLVRGYASLTGGSIVTTEVIGDVTTRLGISSSQGSGSPFDVEIEVAGSSTGLRALIEDTADIAMSSRKAGAGEVAAIAAQGRGDLNGLDQDYVIAVDSILAVVHPSNNIDALSISQLAAIFSGGIRNWSAVGGPNLPINVYRKGDASGTHAVFASKVLSPTGLSVRTDAIEVLTRTDMASSIENDPSAIGYMDFAHQSDGGKGLDLIASCGIRTSADPFSAKTEEYPLQRRLHLYVDNVPMTPEAQGLLDFAVSPAADPLVRDAGFIDLGVTVASAEAMAKRQFADQDAILGRLELATIGNMLKTLGGAQRLSTTLRFEVNSEVLDAKSRRDILRVMQHMAQPEMEGRELILAGFTDGTGGFEINQTLSARRAAAAVAALEAHPLASTLPDVTLSSVGFSELSPVGCNTTDDGRERNRRVELWLK